LLALPWSDALWAALVAAAAAIGMAWLAATANRWSDRRRARGAEQLGETAILVLLRRAAGLSIDGTETNLWLIRHARVDGPRGVIHGPDRAG